MFQNAKFYLVANATVPNQNQLPDVRNTTEVSADEPQECNPVLQHQCKITPTEVGHMNTNIKSCRALENRLAEKLPREEWGLKVEFISFNLEPTTPRQPGQVSRDQQEFRPSSILVSGKILEKIHSLMLYNTVDAKLKLKLSAHLIFQFCSRAAFSQTGRVSTLTTFKYETELIPHSLNGHYDHSYYSSIWRGPTTSIMPKYGLDEFCLNFEIINLNISVEGIDFGLLDPLKSPSPLQEGNKKTLETGFCSDITIIAKDGLKIPCHKMMLCAQSPVLETMLMGSNYLEAATREIPMPDRTKEEVTAFLEFLYCGSLDKAFDDISLAVSLYEMGHYYNVKHLEKEIKSVILSRQANLIDVDTALRLFNFACGSGDPDLKLKAADVLEGKTHDDIFSSQLFKALSPEVTKEFFVMFRRKF